MNHLQNLHTHCTYCDGRDTPEEMIRAAIEKGFGSIGFSSHSYMEFNPSISLSPESSLEYKREMRDLRDKYSGIIDVYCGLELEMHSKVDLEGYDYIIGSTHYFVIDGKHVGFDRSAEQVKAVVDEYFGGDGMAYAKAYYEQISRLPEYADIDIIGHFDIVAKQAYNVELFDVTSAEYLRLAYGAIDALVGKIPLFEVNTGCISRGYRRLPYPTVEITREFARRGFGAVITSDCHDARMLDCAFNEATELLSACGFKEKYILTDRGFEAVPLR